MVHMLHGSPIPLVGGSASKLQAQVSPLGWSVDDLLLTTDAGRLAVSAKGNTQVTSAGLPRDFVERAWEQWRAVPALMDRAKDHLALATNALVVAFDAPWNAVRDACRSPDLELGRARIQLNAKQKRVFDSVLAVQPRPSDAEAMELIRHLHVLPLDLEAEHSTLRAAALAQLRGMLASRESTEAQAVWDCLVGIAARVRIAHGTVLLEELWTELKHRFHFLHRPDFAADWRFLDQVTADNKARTQTAFSSGFTLPRATACDALTAAVTTHPVVELHGESGAGKSALLKQVADSQLTDWAQIWLRPDDLDGVLSASGRARSGFKHLLEDVLASTPARRGLLVLDSAERISQDDMILARQFLDRFRSSSGLSGWHVVIVTQPTDVRPWGATVPVPVAALADDEVQSALRSQARLAWLSTHSQAVANLRNLKTLAWLLESAIALPQTGAPLDYPLIADRLWAHWTEDRPEVQVLTMELACLEANFRPRIPLTELGVERARLLRPKPVALPLRIDRASRVEFEHDLAADLARFEWLKQFTEEPGKWIPLAANPLWRNAFRVFGQYLLREEVGGRAAWDIALAAADAAEGGRSSAGNLLLEALVLDPDVYRFLCERTSQLLADDAAFLARVLNRFRHVSTSRAVQGDASILEVLLAARFRSVVVEQWFPVVRYLARLQEQLQGVESPVLAEVIESWLSQMPQAFDDGRRIPYRRELAKIALEMARAVQAQKVAGAWYVDEGRTIYTATLAGLSDLPDEIGAWALEMAGRRPVHADVLQRVDTIKQAEAAQHAKRMAASDAYRSRHDTSRRLPPTLRPYRTRLPAWPLGPQGEVDRTFRKAILEKGLAHIARHDAPLAVEIFLALLIEEAPERLDDGGVRYEADLGLTSREAPHPSSFNASPLLPFLATAPDAALGAIVELVNFCSDRWAENDGDERPLELTVPGETSRRFTGDCDMLQWSQSSSFRNGHLFAALDALEWWLTTRIDAGEDVTPVVSRLFDETHSVGMLGVLVNVGKRHPALFKGPLLPLVTSPQLYYWDAARVRHIGYTFQASQWIALGEEIYGFMQKWAFAPHRSRTLMDVVVGLAAADEAFAARLRDLTGAWAPPTSPKARLEHAILVAQLDSQNHTATDSGAGTGFILPPDLQRSVDAWSAETRPLTQALMVPRHCFDRLASTQPLTDEEATQLASLLSAFDDVDGLDEQTKRGARIAVAAALLARGNEWLDLHPDVRTVVDEVIEQAVRSLELAPEDGVPLHASYSFHDVRLLAVAIVDQWQRLEGAEVWERRLVRLLTSSDRAAATAVVGVAYASRAGLGATWWRLLRICTMWAGLALLSPHYGDPPSTLKRWHGWRERLVRLRVWGVPASLQDLRLDRVALAVHRLEFHRQVRNAAGSQEWDRRTPEFGRGLGLHSQILDGAFDWLLDGKGTGDWDVDVVLCTALWNLEVAGARPKRAGSELHLPSDELGYKVVASLARKMVDAPAGMASTAWMPVIGLGPDGEAAVRHFLAGMYLKVLQEGADSRFEKDWACLVTYMLRPEWSPERLGYRAAELIGRALGFGQESALARMPSGVVGRHSDLYRRWASLYLHRDEGAVSNLCALASSDLGVRLRRDAFLWLTAALPRLDPRLDKVESGLLELCHKALREQPSELRMDGEFRGAVLHLLDWLAARGSAPALVLQQQVRLINT